jgi:hypothetical protein
MVIRSAEYFPERLFMLSVYADGSACDASVECADHRVLPYLIDARPIHAHSSYLWFRRHEHKDRRLLSVHQMEHII